MYIMKVFKSVSMILIIFSICLVEVVTFRSPDSLTNASLPVKFPCGQFFNGTDQRIIMMHDSLEEILTYCQMPLNMENKTQMAVTTSRVFAEMIQDLAGNSKREDKGMISLPGQRLHSFRRLLSTDSKGISHLNGNDTLGEKTRISDYLKDISLELLLSKVILENMMECDLIVLVTRNYRASRILEVLAKIPNFKQIVFIDSLEDLAVRIHWTSLRCQGAILLMSDLLDWTGFGNGSPLLWDYNARVLVAGSTKESLEEFLNTMKARKTEHIVGVVKGQTEGHYRIFINNLLSRGGLSQISNWRGSSFTNNKYLFPDKTSNLHKIPLNVILFDHKPTTMYLRDARGNVIKRFGRDVEIVENLSEIFNFTMNFMEPHPEELWGFRQPNGSFNGIVGLLERGEGDLAIGSIFVNDVDGRRTFQGYSVPFADDQGCYLARVDPPLPRWHSPVLPFQMTTWFGLSVGLLLAGPVLYYLTLISHQRGQEEFGPITLSRLSLFAFGIHFSHPMARLPTFSSTRVFVAFLWIYSIILTTAYKSNLTAFFTIIRQPSSIETSKGLYEAEFKIIGYPYWKRLFGKSENKYMKGLFGNFEIRKQFHEIAPDVLAGRAVTITNKKYLEFARSQMVTKKGQHLVRILKECVSTNSIALGMQRNTPLKPPFDKMITRMFESGLVNFWFLRSFSLYKQLQKQNQEEQVYQTTNELGEAPKGATSLSLEHLQGIFFILGFGYAVSLPLFALEVCTVQK